MLPFDVTGTKVKIDSHGSQAGMSQYPLQAKDVAAVGQIPFRECVAKSMRRASHPGDAGAAAEPSDHLLDTVSG